MKKNVKRLVCITLILSLVLALAACSGAKAPASTQTPAPATQAPAASAAAASQKPAGKVPDVLKVGFVADLTGAFAASGTFMKNGWVLYMKEHSQKLAGMKVEYIVEDNNSDPAVSVTKTQKLVENDKVDIVVGAFGANAGLAMAPYCIEKKVPYFVCCISAEALTQHQFSKYVMRTGWCSGQPMKAMADYAYNTAKVKTMAVVANDYAFQYEQVGALKLAFEKLGGKITNIQWVPLAGKDFGPYVSGIPKDVDAIYSGIVGGNGPTMIQEMANYGIMKDKVIFASGSACDECYLKAIGDAGVGVISALHYSAAVGTPVCDNFVTLYKNEYGDIPAYASENGYTVGTILDQMYQKVLASGADYNDIDAMNKAFQSVTVDAPRGPISIDNYNHPIENIYIRKIEKTPNGKYGTYQNTVIATLTKQSQWGNYTPQERLALPQFSKEWPFNAK